MYRGMAAGMGHMPEPLATASPRGVAGIMALRGGPALVMNERHMRRVLASECADGVEPDPALVRRWSTRTFDSYARYWCDGARLPYESEAGVRARWQLLEGHEHLRAALDRGRGIVMALPHVGSWEWGGYWLGLEGMPMTAVVERLEPEELFEWFIGQRAAMGLTAVPLGEGSSSALLRALKANQIAGLVSDRDLVGNGVEVEFFGEKTTLPGRGRHPGPAHRGAAAARRRLLGPGQLAHGRRAPAARHLAPGPDARGHRAGDPGPGHRLRARHPRPARAVAPLPAQLAERPSDEDRHGLALRARQRPGASRGRSSGWPARCAPAGTR